MKEKTMFVILLVAIVFLTFYTSVSYAKNVDVDIKNMSLPILVEALEDDGEVLLAYFYPNTDTLCFITLTSRVCMDSEGFSTEYLDFVHSRVSKDKRR